MEGIFKDIEQNVHKLWKHLQRGMTNAFVIIGTQSWKARINFRE